MKFLFLFDQRVSNRGLIDCYVTCTITIYNINIIYL